jgi:hypothetical protein
MFGGALNVSRDVPSKRRRMSSPGSEVLFQSETDFHIFVRGGWINIWGVLLLALAGARWQRPERPRKMFNKICFLGLHGKI